MSFHGFLVLKPRGISIEDRALERSCEVGSAGEVWKCSMFIYVGMNGYVMENLMERILNLEHDDKDTWTFDEVCGCLW